MKKIIKKLNYKINYKIFTITTLICIFLNELLMATPIFASTNMTDPGYIPHLEASTKDGFLKPMDNYKKEISLLLSGFMGVFILTSIIAFIYNLCMLAYMGSFPQNRVNIVHNLLISGVGLALGGGSGLIISIIFTFAK